MTKQKPIETNSSKAAKSAVPAVEKALDVIELVAGSPNGLTMNEIVDTLERTMGELYRVVVYLTERGYLMQNADSGRYSLTLRLFELSHLHDPTQRLIHAALPILESIASRTNQSCHIGVVNRENVLVLASVQSPRPAGYSVRTGAMFPVEQTSSGHVILAFSSQQTQERYLALCPESERAKTAKRLERICSDGYEDTPSTMINGVRNLCVPVFDTRGVVSAITCGFIAQRGESASAAETLTTIRNSAIELSQSLGFRLESSPFEAAITP